MNQNQTYVDVHLMRRPQATKTRSAPRSFRGEQWTLAMWAESIQRRNRNCRLLKRVVSVHEASVRLQF